MRARRPARASSPGSSSGTLAYLWVAVTISMALLGLVFVGLLPRAADTAAAAGKRVAASFGWGALVGIVGPMAAVLVLVTILGIPLGLTMLSALNVLAPIGYVTAVADHRAAVGEGHRPTGRASARSSPGSGSCAWSR